MNPDLITNWPGANLSTEQSTTIWLRDWFTNPKYTPMAQVIIAFGFGVIFSPWSSGIFPLAVFILVYEILHHIFTHNQAPYNDPLVRAAVICSSVLGYIVGRTVAGDEILAVGYI